MNMKEMAESAGFRVFGGKIVAADDGNSGLATESVMRLIEIIRRECANEIETKSSETYSVLLCEHKEAADWLRSNA